MHHSNEATNDRLPTILCVDDQPEVVDSIARQLHRYAVHVKKALHGLQGIWMASTEKADLVITDVRMPLADGTDLLEIVRHIPVIAVTGLQEAGIEKRLLAHGAAAVLFKPVDFDQLIHEIQKFIPLVERTSTIK